MPRKFDFNKVRFGILVSSKKIREEMLCANSNNQHYIFPYEKASLYKFQTTLQDNFIDPSDFSYETPCLQHHFQILTVNIPCLNPVLRGLINGFKDQIRGFKDQIRGFKDQIRGFKDQIRGFKDQIRGFKDQIKGFKDQIKGFKDQIKGFKDQIKGFKDQIRSYNSPARILYNQETSFPFSKIILLFRHFQKFSSLINNFKSFSLYWNFTKAGPKRLGSIFPKSSV